MWAVGRLSLLARGLDAVPRAPEISKPAVEPVAAPVAEAEREAAPSDASENLSVLPAAPRPIEPIVAVEAVEVVEAVTVVTPEPLVREAQASEAEGPAAETPKLAEPTVLEPAATEPVVGETSAEATPEPPDPVDVTPEPDPPRQTAKPKVARVKPIPPAAPPIAHVDDISVEPKPESATAPASTTVFEEAAPEVQVTPAPPAPPSPPTEPEAAAHEDPSKQFSETATNPPSASVTHVAPEPERTVILPPTPRVEAPLPPPRVEAPLPAPPVQALPPLPPPKAERVEIPPPAPSFFQRIVSRVKSFFRSLFG